jgi:hypothetical protein
MQNNVEHRTETDPVYAARIAGLVDRYLTDNPSIARVAPLLEALGCRVPAFENGPWVEDLDENTPGAWRMRVPAQPDPCNEHLVRSTLLQALVQIAAKGLHQYTDNFSILHGASLQQRWRYFLDSTEGAYCFAMLCVEQTRVGGGMQVMALRGSNSGITLLLSVLNDWLQPTVEYDELPSLPDLCSALFGKEWYQFTIEMANVRDADIPELIYTTRPAFSPGLISARLEGDSAILPALEGP